MDRNEIAIIGGTGFVGRHLVNALARQDVSVRVLTRRRERNRELLVFPRVQLVETDVYDRAALIGTLAGVDTVIHLPAILNQQGADSFQKVHVDLVRAVTEAAVANGVKRFLHMSALGAAKDAPSEYLRTKAAGEDHAHSVSELDTTSFRPSVIFGRKDHFFNRFLQLLKMSPGVFPLACPNARFAPVFVEDVAEAMIKCLKDKNTFSRRYDLCGPETYSLRELVEYTAAVGEVHRKVIALSDGLSQLQARVLEFFPGKPFSMDNYRSTKVDSVCECNGLKELGIVPRSLESIVPTYLGGAERNRRLRQLREAHRD